MNSTVRDVMSTHVIAARQGASFKDMAAMLRNQRVSAFPVIDDDNKVIGVVSEADLLTKACPLRARWDGKRGYVTVTHGQRAIGLAA